MRKNFPQVLNPVIAKLYIYQEYVGKNIDFEKIACKSDEALF